MLFFFSWNPDHGKLHPIAHFPRSQKTVSTHKRETNFPGHSMECLMKNTRVFSFPPALCAFSSSWARPKKAAPSEYQCRYSLRVRLFHRWQPVLWNPCAFGDRDLSPESRYSCQHAHSRVLQKRSPFSFDGTQDAPLPRRRCFFFSGLPSFRWCSSVPSIHGACTLTQCAGTRSS